MKKILLCLILCSSLFLIACNNTNLNQSNNSSSSTQEMNNEINKSPVIEYDSTDFSEKAGFKVNLGTSFENVKYDSVFLISETIAQLDLSFPNKTIGTLLIDASGYSNLAGIDNVVFINDTKVSIENGFDGIYTYEWTKGNYTFTFSTSIDIKDSDTLTNLVNDVTIEETK